MNVVLHVYFMFPGLSIHDTQRYVVKLVKGLGLGNGFEGTTIIFWPRMTTSLSAILDFCVSELCAVGKILFHKCASSM